MLEVSRFWRKTNLPARQEKIPFFSFTSRICKKITSLNNWKIEAHIKNTFKRAPTTDPAKCVSSVCQFKCALASGRDRKLRDEEQTTTEV